MNKQSLIILVAGLLAMLGGIGVKGIINSSSAQSQQLALPEFTLMDLSGQPHSINEWAGKVRVINFWATWCPPCLKEMPEFNTLQQEYAGKNVQVIGIALDDLEPVKEFIAAKKIGYVILLGGDQGIKLARSLGNLVDAVPFTLVVDSQGRIVKTYMGELQPGQIKEAILPLIQM